MIAFTREKSKLVQKKFKELLGFVKSKDFLASFLKGVLVGSILLVFGGYGAYRIAYVGKVFPGLAVNTINVSGMSPEEALYVLGSDFETYLYEHQSYSLVFGDKTWNLDYDELESEVDAQKMRQVLLSYGRDGSLLNQISDQWQLFFNGKVIPLEIAYNTTLLDDFVATAAAEVDNPFVPPQIKKEAYYNPQTKSLISYEPGSDGEVVVRDETKEAIVYNLRHQSSSTSLIVTAIDSLTITDDQIIESIQRAKNLLGKSLALYYEDAALGGKRINWQLTDDDLISFLSAASLYDVEAIDNYVASVAETVNRPAQNALFSFDETTQKASTFKPAKMGLVVRVDDLRNKIISALRQLDVDVSTTPIKITLLEVAPKITTADVNDLGINELLGRGESTYYHSSAGRKHNVEHAAKLMHGVLIPPGETFSFNKTLGEVSIATGFKQALVIRDGQTLMDNGGGVCQDSTTLFRAVLDAGLPILSWQNHSFRVGYYEQNSKPGFDATVFSPYPDFTFANDTEGHILIQTHAENMTLAYELYGTDDGRVATISNYSQWGAAPPPPDLYQDDPSLPAGTVKKVESAVPGLKTKFDYTVEKDGEVVFEKTFVSVYKPWQAVYLRGTGQ